MKKRILLIALAMLFVGGPPVLAASEKAPPVSDIRIDQPDPSLPDEVKALSGRWAGQWNSRWDWDCVLYVERVDRDSARVVHSWGEYTTSKGSCHCAPDWRRVEKARVTYSEGRATLEFTAPPYRPLQGLNPSHAVSGSIGPSRKKYYTFSFTVEKGAPGVMKGHFISGKASQLRIEMKRVD